MTEEWSDYRKIDLDKLQSLLDLCESADDCPALHLSHRIQTIAKLAKELKASRGEGDNYIKSFVSYLERLSEGKAG